MTRRPERWTLTAMRIGSAVVRLARGRYSPGAYLRGIEEAAARCQPMAAAKPAL